MPVIVIMDVSNPQFSSSDDAFFADSSAVYRDLDPIIISFFTPSGISF